jgi:adenine phosphoribosyltransferase
VLLVDDLLATGGTLEACAQLVEMSRATLAGITVLIELEAFAGRARLARHGEVHSVLRY